MGNKQRVSRRRPDAASKGRTDETSRQSDALDMDNTMHHHEHQSDETGRTTGDDDDDDQPREDDTKADAVGKG